MLKSSLVFFLIFCGAVQAEVRVRVKLMNRSVQGLVVQGSSLNVLENSDFKKVSIGPRESIELESVRSFEGSHLWAYFHKSSEREKKNPFLFLKGKDMTLSGVPVPDEIFLWPTGSHNVDVVAILNLEEYLRGVIPSEMPLEWPLEALKAQAVLARSYVLHQMKRFEKRHYHVDSSVLDQRYIFSRNIPSSHFKKIKQIEEETRGEILKNPSGRLVKALFHADCGGQTTQEESVWGKDPKKTETIVDPGCPSPLNANWSHRVSKKDLVKKLLLKGNLVAVKAEPPTSVLRPLRVLFQTDVETQSISPQVIRSALGFHSVRSAVFDLEIEGDHVIFKGKGFGHGVGLCQNGAKNLARMNKNYKEILKYYFPRYTLSHL